MKAKQIKSHRSCNIMTALDNCNCLLISTNIALKEKYFQSKKTVRTMKYTAHVNTYYL